jgi:hypothetical protein
MAQQKTIQFTTTTTVDPNGGLLVLSQINYYWYVGSWSACTVHKGEITKEPKTENSVYSLEGNLIIAMEDNLVNCAIDINGNLLILYEYGSDFSINENGELIYSF